MPNITDLHNNVDLHTGFILYSESASSSLMSYKPPLEAIWNIIFQNSATIIIVSDIVSIADILINMYLLYACILL